MLFFHMFSLIFMNVVSLSDRLLTLNLPRRTSQLHQVTLLISYADLEQRGKGCLE